MCAPHPVGERLDERGAWPSCAARHALGHGARRRAPVRCRCGPSTPAGKPNPRDRFVRPGRGSAAPAARRSRTRFSGRRTPRGCLGHGRPGREGLAHVALALAPSRRSGPMHRLILGGVAPGCPSRTGHVQRLVAQCAIVSRWGLCLLRSRRPRPLRAGQTQQPPPTSGRAPRDAVLLRGGGGDIAHVLRQQGPARPVGRLAARPRKVQFLPLRCSTMASA